MHPALWARDSCLVQYDLNFLHLHSGESSRQRIMIHNGQFWTHYLQILGDLEAAGLSDGRT